MLCMERGIAVEGQCPFLFAQICANEKPMQGSASVFFLLDIVGILVFGEGLIDLGD